jgi:hypothetical protein
LFVLPAEQDDINWAKRLSAGAASSFSGWVPDEYFVSRCRYSSLRKERSSEFIGDFA